VAATPNRQIALARHRRRACTPPARPTEAACDVHIQRYLGARGSVRRRAGRRAPHRWLAEHAVPTIHLSIGIAPLSVECDRITVIDDPADALEQIAADTVAALRAARRGR
jgi:hypothetical protein